MMLYGMYQECMRNPEPPLDPPEPEPMDPPTELLDCGHEIREDETAYELDGKWVCEDCFWEEVKSLPRWELAEYMNIRTRGAHTWE